MGAKEERDKKKKQQRVKKTGVKNLKKCFYSIA